MNQVSGPWALHADPLSADHVVPTILPPISLNPSLRIGRGGEVGGAQSTMIHQESVNARSLVCPWRWIGLEANFQRTGLGIGAR